MSRTEITPLSASEIDDDWWCWECHGLGSWPDEDDSGEDVECHCCGGDGVHRGDAKPSCAGDIVESEIPVKGEP